MASLRDPCSVLKCALVISAVFGECGTSLSGAKGVVAAMFTPFVPGACHPIDEVAFELALPGLVPGLVAEAGLGRDDSDFRRFADFMPCTVGEQAFAGRLVLGQRSPSDRPHREQAKRCSVGRTWAHGASLEPPTFPVKNWKSH